MTRAERQKADIALALEMGKKAFADGKQRVAMYDNNVMELVEKYGTPDQAYHNVVMRILHNWSKGWDTANLA